MMVLDNKFEIEQTVYLKTDIEQKERIVTGFYVRNTSITYGLSCGTEETFHYDFEITVNVNILKRTNN
jgi:hypothetical protein